MEVKDYYRVLSVPRNATHKEIHEAYQRLRDTTISPNAGMEAMNFLREVGEAITILGDAQKREAYNQHYDEVIAKSAQATTQSEGRESGGTDTPKDAPQPDVDRMAQYLREMDGNAIHQMKKQQSKPEKKPTTWLKELGLENIAALIFAVLIVLGLAFYSAKRLYLVLAGDVESSFWSWALPIGGLLLSAMIVFGWTVKKASKE